jgi:hypothetical protein
MIIQYFGMQRVEFVTRSLQNQDIEKTSSTQAKWLACRTGAIELQISMELLAGLAAVASASCMTSCMNKDMHRQCHCKGVWQDRESENLGVEPGKCF